MRSLCCFDLIQTESSYTGMNRPLYSYSAIQVSKGQEIDCQIKRHKKSNFTSTIDGRVIRETNMKYTFPYYIYDLFASYVKKKEKVQYTSNSSMTYTNYV